MLLPRARDGIFSVFELAVMDTEGRTVRRAMVHPRLEQALFLVVERENVEGTAVRAG